MWEKKKKEWDSTDERERLDGDLVACHMFI